jgi:hypothetical protein
MHLVDTRLPPGVSDRRKMKRVTLHAEAILLLKKVLPEIVAKVHAFEEEKDTSSSDSEADDEKADDEDNDDDDDTPPKRKKSKSKKSLGGTQKGGKRS